MNAFTEGLKQLARVALVAVIPLIIEGLRTGKLDWGSIGVVGAIAVLMGIDKWLHKEDTGIGGNGLTVF